MQVFKSLKEAEKYILKHVEDNLEIIGKHVKSVLENFILNDLYRTYTPSEYERTQNFLHAVTVSAVKKKGNIREIEIYIDPEKLQQIQRPLGEWSAHMSSLGKNYGDTEYQGKSISEWLIYWLETGDNTSPFSRGKIGMIENTREWLEDDHYIYNTMKSRFEDAGFKVIGGYL